MSVAVSSPILASRLRERKDVKNCMDVAETEKRRVTINPGLNSGHEHYYKVDRDGDRIDCFKQDADCEVLLTKCNFGGCQGEWHIHSEPLP